MTGKKQPVILICGPTGVGKSDLAVELALRIGGEIISADSVQVYRGLDIGSAKITTEEMCGVKHHLIDIIDPDEEYGVNVFQTMAARAISKIAENGHIPIVVGGTAFYIQALMYGIDFTEEEDNDRSYRNSLMELGATTEGAMKLWDELNLIDSEYAASTHYNNVKRVVRALEYYHNTGRRFSDYNREQSERLPVYDCSYFALTDDRELLYERINKRVDVMVKNGLVDEVKGLLDKGYDQHLNSMSSIGYKEICEYLSGNCPYDEAIDMIKQNSRHYAKRQLTWLRREKDVLFINRQDYPDNEGILDYIQKVIDKKEE